MQRVSLAVKIIAVLTLSAFTTTLACKEKLIVLVWTDTCSLVVKLSIGTGFKSSVK